MKTKFKLLLGLIISVIMFGSQLSVFAGEIFIKDIAAREGYMQGIALTNDGVVFSSDNITKMGKTKIKENVASLSDSCDVFLMKNGDVDFRGKIISGLNVKRIITVKYEFYYNSQTIVFISNDDVLKVYDCSTDECYTIVENVADCEYGDYWLSARTKANDLFSVEIIRNASSVSEAIKVNFIVSDVCDYEKVYFLKNNGQLYYIQNGSSNLILTDVDIWQGIVLSSNPDKVIVYSNGNFNVIEKGKITQKYSCKHGVNDIMQYGNDIFYIGKDNLLYYLDIHSYYGYHQPGTEKEYCFSNSLHFQKLYYSYYSAGYLYCLDEYNNLYIPQVEVFVDSNGNNYNGKYENIKISLGNFAPNAVPKKILGNYILTEAGECFVRSSDSIYMHEFSNKKLNLLINKNNINLVAPIQNKNGRTMYPLRECFEAMGAAVSWDGINQIAIGEIPGIKIEFPIGKNEYYINGVRHEMDTVSYVDENINRTYIPIRYAAEGLGFTVDWIPGDIENTISIHK